MAYFKNEGGQKRANSSWVGKDERFKRKLQRKKDRQKQRKTSRQSKKKTINVDVESQEDRD